MNQAAGVPFTAQPIEWQRTGDGEYPYQADVAGVRLTVRVNDFPAEPLYSLLLDHVPDQDLEDWPACWTRPRTWPAQVRAAGTAQARRGRIDPLVAAAWATALCELPRATAAEAVAALELTGALRDDIGYQLLEPPPPGTSRLEVAELHGDVFTVEAAVTAGPSRADLDSLLGRGGDVPRVHYDRPYPVCYPVTVVGAPYTCDIFAYFAAPSQDGGGAQTLMFRRQAAARAEAEPG